MYVYECLCVYECVWCVCMSVSECVFVWCGVCVVCVCVCVWNLVCHCKGRWYHRGKVFGNRVLRKIFGSKRNEVT